MLVAMAGLPSTGKSTIAAGLEREVGAVVLDKDRVRVALFPPPVLDYSAGQDDLAMAAVYRAAAAILRADPRRVVVLDGRTFSRPGQFRELLEAAAGLGEVPRVIECVYSDEVACQRLAADRARGDHPAANRTFALYRELQAAAEPLGVPRLVLATGTLPVEECVRRCREYLGL